MCIIQVENVIKEYKLGQQTSFKDSVHRVWAHLRGQTSPVRKPFNAIDNISFSVEEGEIVGIIGTNGAGKSTLLKLISGISNSTSGHIAVKGKIAPLIEVGAGLHPELTGRENVFLNASIMGVPRATIKQRFEEIVSFAEIEEFIDTPIKRYSSGMKVRLGFSIATSVNADILVVDEVLAVGDLAFQRKCFDRMEEKIKRQGKTVLMVSHNIRQIERLCTRVIMLDHGKVYSEGKPKEICEQFYKSSNIKISTQAKEQYKNGQNVRMTGEIELNSLSLIDENGNECQEVLCDSPVTIRGIFHSNVEIIDPEIIYGFHTTDMVYIASMGTAHLEGQIYVAKGENTIDCHIKNLPLAPGIFAIRACVLDKYRREMLYGETLHIFTVQTDDIPISKRAILGLINIPVVWKYNNSKQFNLIEALPRRSIGSINPMRNVKI